MAITFDAVWIIGKQPLLQQQPDQQLRSKPSPDLARYLLESHTFLLWYCLLVTAQEPEISPDGDATIWYPVPLANGSRIAINAIDTLVVSYEAKWSLVNISMWCLTNNIGQKPYTGIDLQSPREYFCHRYGQY